MIKLPRLPVDGKKVIEHRITFGAKERELLDQVTLGYQFNKISTPLVALVSDVSAMAFLTSVYLSYMYGEDAITYLKESYESAEELYKDAYTITRSLPVIGSPLIGFDIVKDFIGRYT